MLTLVLVCVAAAIGGLVGFFAREARHIIESSEIINVKVILIVSEPDKEETDGITKWIMNL